MMEREIFSTLTIQHAKHRIPRLPDTGMSLSDAQIPTRGVRIA